MSPVVPERPWESLPAKVVPVLRDELDAVADEILAAIAEGVPDYAQPFEGAFGRNIRRGVHEALRQFIALIEDPHAGRGTGREVYVELGRGEVRSGRSLDALLSAYRLGARVAWRRYAAAGERAQLSPRTLYLLAESIFAYIDELSGDSIEGYASEQAAAAGAQQRRRQRLARLLIQDPPAAPAAIEEAAADAGWALPAALTVTVVHEAEPDRLAMRTATDVLVGPAPRRSASAAPADGGDADRGDAGTDVLVVVPDPDGPGRRAELETAVRDHWAASGPAVSWPEAPLSYGRADRLLRLALRDMPDGVASLLHADAHPPSAASSGAAPAAAARPGASSGPASGAAPPHARSPGPATELSPAPRLLRADEHGLALLLGSDRQLALDVAEHALAPLVEEGERSRERLAETLAAWLRHRGRTAEVARALHVHPQTVRYRLGRLRDLFGDQLEDPDARFELEVALRLAPRLAPDA
jgi:PucR C-terminal helix-turn-helix domain